MRNRKYDQGITYNSALISYRWKRIGLVSVGDIFSTFLNFLRNEHSYKSSSLRLSGPVGNVLD